MKLNHLGRLFAVAVAAMISGACVLPVEAAGGMETYLYDDALTSKYEGVYAASKIPTVVKLSKSSFTYTGKAIIPTFTVKDGNKVVDKKYYTVSAVKGDNTKTVGSHKVTIKFKSPYSGSKTFSYNIIPKGTSIGSITATKNTLTIKYKKQSDQTSGYEIQYSTASNFNGAKSAKITKNTTVTKKLTGLSSGRKYYVRIRAYKMIGGKSYNSTWSSIKTITTQKNTDSGEKTDTTPNSLDNLTFDRIINMFIIEGKPLKNWTVETLHTYIKSRSTSNFTFKDEFYDGNDTAYLFSNNLLGLYKEYINTHYKTKAYSAETMYNKYNKIRISKSDFGIIYYLDYDHYNGASGTGTHVNDVLYWYKEGSMIAKHPFGSSLENTVNNICPNLYEKSINGGYKGKGYRVEYGVSTYDNDIPVINIIFDDGKSVELTYNGGNIAISLAIRNKK